MRKFTLTLLAFVAIMAIAVPTIGAQTDEPVVTEEAPEPTPEGTEEPMVPVATDDMDMMAATEEMAPTEDMMSSTEEAMATQDVMGTEEAQPQSTTAYVRFAHFAPDAGTVDIAVDGDTADTQGIEHQTVSDWMALPAGTHSVTVGAGETVDVSLTGDTWTTLVVSGSAADGTLMLSPVQEQIEQMQPGVATITFVNALTGTDMEVNFVRDGQIMVSQLAPLGADTGVGSTTTLPTDYGVYTYGVTETANAENVIGELPDTTITETNDYLFAVVGTPDDMQVILDEAPRAEIQIARDELPEPGTIVEALRNDERLAPFADAVEAAGLTEMLSGEGPYTVFAPIDYAMDEIRARYDTPEDLESYLRGLIVEGDVKFNPLIEQGTATSLDGQSLEIALSGNTATVNDAEILAPNIPATNGTIHIIGESPAG